MKAIINENYLNRKEDLSIEELKKVTCLQGLSDDELQEAAATLKEFTQIVYEIFAAGQSSTPVINMNTNISKSEAA
jgi:hypothetical protein